jgi:GAF domain-containing protein
VLNRVIIDALNQVARELEHSRDVDELLDAIVVSIRESLPEIDHAGISVTHRDGRIETRAWTGDLVIDLDQLQYDLNEGPCVDAMNPGVPDDVVRVDHARHDQRWPGNIPHALEAGLRAQLGLRLYTEEETVGGLNLYSTSADVISEDTEFLAEMYATHAALALGRIRKETQLVQALGTRTLIGQATGIVMERYDLDAHRAFDYLMRVSQTSNVKIRDLADELVNHHALPVESLQD